jgi:hypothetical protein
MADFVENLDHLNREIWGDRRTFEDLVHVMGGFGLGLLFFPTSGTNARLIGQLALGLSIAAHLYAYFTKPAVPTRSGLSSIFNW